MEYVFPSTFHVHTFHFSCWCPHFFIVSSMLELFSHFLLVCLKNFEKIQKMLLTSFLVFLVVVFKRNPKIFPCSSFACWELSRVNSFSCFCFSLLFAFFQENKKLQKYFSVFLSISFLFIESYRGEDHNEHAEWLSYALLLI